MRVTVRICLRSDHLAIREAEGLAGLIAQVETRKGDELGVDEVQDMGKRFPR